MELTTPALLFPAISLLFLAYTNRFLVLAQLIRQLHGAERNQVRDVVRRQIQNLKKRIYLTKLMQALGVLSFISCSLSMSAILLNAEQLAQICFGTSLALMTASLIISFYEITISTSAIKIELEDLEKQ